MENSEILKISENSKISENFPEKNQNFDKKSDNDNTSAVVTYISHRLANLSNKTILFFSICTSGFMSYKYLKNKEVYEEFNGHYNSPRNLLNQRMKYFHLQEAIVRFGFGLVFIGGGSFILFKKLLKDYLGIKGDKSHNHNKIEFLNKNTAQSPDDNTLLDKNTIALNDYAMNEEKVYDLESVLDRKTRVEKYFNVEVNGNGNKK